MRGGRVGGRERERVQTSTIQYTNKMAIHRLVRDTIMMKKYMAKSNVVLGTGAPHLLGGKVEPRPLKGSVRYF